MQSKHAISQSMEETKKAIQQSNDMQGLVSELKICEYSCIQSQSSSKYSQANCNNSFAFDSLSDTDSSQKTNNTLSSIFWLCVFFLGVRFLLKKKS
jgi:serine protease inhibitor